MNDKYNIVVAGGQGKLKDDIFRIGHMGYMDDVDLISTIATLEMALAELGYPFKLGTGVAASEEVLVGCAY
jgi:aspartate aminotransferase-like enzyme